MRATISALILLAAAAVPLPAQIRPGDNGILVTDGLRAAGNLCRGFTCTPYRLSVAQGSGLRIDLRGTPKQPFWLFLAFKTGSCVQIPGLMHSLVVRPPVFLAAAGTLATPDKILACPGGLASLKWSLPKLPFAYRFDLQALILTSWLNGLKPTFTPAVEVGVS